VTKQKLGQLEEVDLRAIWEDEPRDFTPWLAEHLDQLGEALGLNLRLIESEATVGSFAVDVLAEADDEAVVVIENQLERTDHSHLGQLLTYAAGRDAWTLIWITPEFRDEHRAALDWLNRWTTNEIQAYGVEVRAVRIGDSLPAPEFRAVAFPNDWSRRARSQVSGSQMGDDEWNQRLAFFKELVMRAHERGVASSPNAGAVRRSKSFPLRVDERGLTLWVEWRLTGVVTVHLDISTGDVDRNEEIIGSLDDQRNAVASDLRFEPEYFFPDPDGPHGRMAARVMMFRDLSIHDSQEEIAKTVEWCVDKLAGFQRVLEPRLRTIISELDSKEA